MGIAASGSLDDAPLLDAWLEGLLPVRSKDLPESAGPSAAVAFTCGMAIGVAAREAHGESGIDASEPEGLQGSIVRVGRSFLLPDRWCPAARRDALHRLLRIHRDLVRIESSPSTLARWPQASPSTQANEGSPSRSNRPRSTSRQPEPSTPLPTTERDR